MPEYSIQENVAWDRIAASRQALAQASSADAICFGTLAQRSTISRDTIQQLISLPRAGALRVPIRRSQRIESGVFA